VKQGRFTGEFGVFLKHLIRPFAGAYRMPPYEFYFTSVGIVGDGFPVPYESPRHGYRRATFARRETAPLLSAQLVLLFWENGA